MAHFRFVRPLVSLFVAGSFALLGGACSSGGMPEDSSRLADEHVGSTDQHLTDAQCLYFDVNGSVTICHGTSSTTHPFTIVKTSEQGCINGHAGHSRDYVAVNDPTCQGGGCLPTGAPCDATLPCCSGSSCQNGTCVQDCVPTTCAAQGATCGTISDGCGDTLDCGSCGAGFACDAGQCVDVDDCASNPCVHGTCVDGVNSFTCNCDSGYSGTLCDTAASTCPCAGNADWQSAMAGTIVTDGRCTNYSFPAPCRTSGDFSWAVTENGSSVVELMAGTESMDGEVFSYCGVQVMQVSTQFTGNCSGGSFPVMLTTLTATQAADCRADILALAAAQNATCH